MPALKSTTIFPTVEEDAMITTAALSDADSIPLTNEEWNRIKPMLTAMPSNINQRITVKLSANVVEAFKATGKNWQDKMDNVLQDWLHMNSV
ncbi:MAG: BrnA antitoxin family protein [Methylococcaceae bacterium]|jgi:uncharacterized protein (DUF4415 family)